MSFDLSNYVDVKTRIKLFYERYPEGSLQFEFKGTMGEYIWGVAHAYRHPEDPRPATGTAAELAQGKTPYTKGSELQNLESSAWGRAIGALGIGIETSVATKDEVKFAQDRQAQDPWGLDVASPVEQALQAMGATPLCACTREMEHRKFQRKSDGKWVSGYFCVNDTCKVLWDKN